MVGLIKCLAAFDVKTLPAVSHPTMTKMPAKFASINASVSGLTRRRCGVVSMALSFSYCVTSCKYAGESGSVVWMRVSRSSFAQLMRAVISLLIFRGDIGPFQ